MNNDQSKYFKLFIAVQTHLDSHTQVWNTIPRAVKYKNDLDEIIARLQEKSKDVQDQLPVTANKEVLKAQIALKAATLSGALQAYANDKEDNDLAKKVKITISDVKRAKETDLDAQITAITKIAKKDMKELADFGITNDNVSEIETSLADFNALIGKPRIILNNKYVAIESVSSLIDEGNALIKKKMDNIMLIFKESHPEFHSGYERARSVVG